MADPTFLEEHLTKQSPIDCHVSVSYTHLELETMTVLKSRWLTLPM